jgi:hypothetical protein
MKYDNYYKYIPQKIKYTTVYLIGKAFRNSGTESIKTDSEIKELSRKRCYPDLLVVQD